MIRQSLRESPASLEIKTQTVKDVGGDSNTAAHSTSISYRNIEQAADTTAGNLLLLNQLLWHYKLQKLCYCYNETTEENVHLAPQ